MPAAQAYRIETARLVLRCWEPGDAALLNAAVASSVEHLRPWMAWSSEPLPTLEARAAQLREWRTWFDRGEAYMYGIFDAVEAVAIGSTGLHARVGPGALEIGYWIASDQLRRGYASEATAALTRVAFEVNKVERVEIQCAAENAISAAIPRRLGFQHEARLRRRILDGAGRLVDADIFCLFDDEYPLTPSARAPVRAFDAAGAALLCVAS
jgi:RimJ/RimL family protein N-acetyltransferase